MLALIDTLRQLQGDGLGRLGLGPTECRYQIVAASARWRLRAYAGATAGPSLLIVAAPIKRPYIWDLADRVSVVRHCLRHRLRVYLSSGCGRRRAIKMLASPIMWDDRSARRSPQSRRKRAGRDRLSWGIRSAGHWRRFSQRWTRRAFAVSSSCRRRFPLRPAAADSGTQLLRWCHLPSRRWRLFPVRCYRNSASWHLPRPFCGRGSRMPA